MPRYVYTLSTYEEDGAEEVMATLDRANLATLLDSWFGDIPEDVSPHVKESLVAYRAEAHRRLDEKLRCADDGLADSRGGHPLAPGWGAVQLHVVELS